MNDELCSFCVNKGKINGLSQETFCESCVHQQSWRSDYFDYGIEDTSVKSLIDGLNKQEIQMRINAKKWRKLNLPDHHCVELEGAADITRDWINNIVKESEIAT